MMEDTKEDEFMQKTKASSVEAKNYLRKFGSVNEAVKKYQEHQKMIEKFANEQKCDKKAARDFLEANNYDTSCFNL